MKDIDKVVQRKKGKNFHDNVSEDELDIRAAEIEGALDAGNITYGGIAEHTGLTVKMIQNVFERRIETYAYYRKCLMSMKAIAADNVVDTLVDKKNPKNWEATKWFATRYKTVLDDCFTRDRDDDVQVSVDLQGNQTEGGTGGSRVNITFSSQSKKTEAED